MNRAGGGFCLRKSGIQGHLLIIKESGMYIMYIGTGTVLFLEIRILNIQGQAQEIPGWMCTYCSM